jgi:hypothetical protein
MEPGLTKMLPQDACPHGRPLDEGFEECPAYQA